MQEGLLGWIEDQIERFFRRYHKMIKAANGIGYNFALNGTGSGFVKNGAVSINVLSNKTGRVAEIGRVVVTCDGVTPATPRNAAATEWWGLFINPGANLADLLEFKPDAALGKVFPWVFANTGHNAYRLRNGEDLYFELRNSGLADNTQVYVSVFGAYEPADSDFDL